VEGAKNLCCPTGRDEFGSGDRRRGRRDDKVVVVV